MALFGLETLGSTSMAAAALIIRDRAAQLPPQRVAERLQV